MEFSQRNSAFTNLRRFVRRSAAAAVEHCELCSEALAPEHQHLIEPVNRKLICSCDACAILFSGLKAKYRRVPRTTRRLADFQMTDAQWESLMIPINMAFFFYSSPPEKTVVLYPSPAGPTESLLPLESWEEIAAANPVLKKMEADTEALLVNRMGRERYQTEAEYYIVPIDKCYELTGLIRAYWQGLSGGKEVWEKIAEFFSELKKRATVVGEERLKIKN